MISPPDPESALDPGAGLDAYIALASQKAAESLLRKDIEHLAYQGRKFGHVLAQESLRFGNGNHAFIGEANMITLESAYSKKKGTPAPVARILATAALDGWTLDQISNRIPRWYEANPARRNMPVVGVIWIDMIQPASAPK